MWAAPIFFDACWYYRAEDEIAGTMTHATGCWVGIAFGYLLAANLLAFGMFALDKSSSQVGGRRISEVSLLFVALVGGSIGAMVAQHFLRHKTRKEPFRSALFTIIAVQCFMLPVLLYPPARRGFLLFGEKLLKMF